MRRFTVLRPATTSQTLARDIGDQWDELDVRLQQSNENPSLEIQILLE